MEVEEKLVMGRELEEFAAGNPMAEMKEGGVKVEMGFRGRAWGRTDGGSSTSSSIDCLTGTESLMDLVNGSILGRMRWLALTLGWTLWLDLAPGMEGSQACSAQWALAWALCPW